MHVFLAIILAYFLGAIPTAYIFGKVLKGIDIREFGSGNVGATNVFRIVGKVPGIIVLLLDFLKGFVAVKYIPVLFNEIFSVDLTLNGSVLLLLAAAAITGHIWTVFLKFKGGKGVATTAGVMVALSPWVFLAGLAVWVVIFSVWKYVSLASIIASVALPVFALISGADVGFVIFCSILCLVGVYKHRANIRRLIQGVENKIR